MVEQKKGPEKNTNYVFAQVLKKVDDIERRRRDEVLTDIRDAIAEIQFSYDETGDDGEFLVKRYDSLGQPQQAKVDLILENLAILQLIAEMKEIGIDGLATHTIMATEQVLTITWLLSGGMIFSALGTTSEVLLPQIVVSWLVVACITAVTILRFSNAKEGRDSIHDAILQMKEKEGVKSDWEKVIRMSREELSRNMLGRMTKYSIVGNEEYRSALVRHAINLVGKELPTDQSEKIDPLIKRLIVGPADAEVLSLEALLGQENREQQG